jgi:hypothetical protein
MTGEGIAAILTSLATLVGVIISGVQQLRGQNESRNDRAELREKIDTTAAKVDNNTALTQATAQKVEEVHAVTAAIAESTTGTHQVLK